MTFEPVHDFSLYWPCMTGIDIDMVSDPPAVAAVLRVPAALILRKPADEVQNWVAKQLIEMSNQLGLQGMRTVRVSGRDPNDHDDPSWGKFYDIFAVREHSILRLPPKWIEEKPEEPTN